MNFIQRLKHRHDFIPKSVSHHFDKTEPTTKVNSGCSCGKTYSYVIRGRFMTLTDITE